MTAWQLVGLICTTDSAAGQEKLCQKAMAKSTAILTRVLVLQSHPADHIHEINSALGHRIVLIMPHLQAFLV